LYKRKGLETPIFPPYVGNKYNGLVVLGQSPSKEDDLKQKPFVNKRATVVRSIAYKMGYNLADVGAFTYALSCSVGKGKGTDVQYKCCRDILVKNINELKPKMILCCGEMAFKSLFGLKNKIATSKLRGRVIPNYEFNCIVFTLMNPNDVYKGFQEYAMRKDIERALTLWKKIYHVRKKVKQDLEFKKILDGIRIEEIKTPNKLDIALKHISSWDEVAFDYETTNVKPYDEYFEITHMQFGREKLAYVINESLWQTYPVWRKIKKFVKWLLENKSIHKIIQNDKFEDLCSRHSIGIKRIVNSDCTMLATHVIDERRGCTSLDFQNLTRFGIPPYSDTVKSYLQKKNKDDKTNRIRLAPYDDLITYAGLDVITTWYNWKFLEKVMPKAYDKAFHNYKFLHQGHRVFANMSHRGVKIGIDKLNELEEIFIENIQDTLERIATLPEFIEYNEYLGKQLNTKKEGDNKLEKLQLKIKEVTNDRNKDTARIGKHTIRIKRKLQF
jgi:uracil-DNA glycosylase family 4